MEEEEGEGEESDNNFCGERGMGKITGIYKFNIPVIPVNHTELLTQKPIRFKNNNMSIKIYPPGNDCERIWKRIQGNEPDIKIEVNTTQNLFTNALYIMVEKNAYLPKGTDLYPEYKTLDKEAEDITTKLLRLLRKQLPYTSLNIPNHLNYKSTYKLISEEHEHKSLGGTTKGIKVDFQSPEYNLGEKKWLTTRNEIKKNDNNVVWRDFLYDASESIRSGDLLKAVIFSSIGHEIFIKEYTEKVAIKIKLSQPFWSYIKNRQPRVLDYYDSILHLLTGHSLKTENPVLWQTIDRMNTVRNKVVHSGKLILSTQENRQLIKDLHDIEKIITWVDAL